MKVKVINKSSNPLPAYATEFAAGLDVRADNAEPIELKPLGRAMVPTGLYLEIPAGYEAQLVLARHEVIEWEQTDELAESGRGAGGFGSTGTK